MKMLYAEDDEFLQKRNKKFFISAGFEVDEACNGEIAWKLFQENVYDLVLTDMYMPEKTGEELIQAIRKENPKIPIFVYSSVELERLEGKKKANKFFSKDMDSKDMISKIKVIMEEIETNSCMIGDKKKKMSFFNKLFRRF